MEQPLTRRRPSRPAPMVPSTMATDVSRQHRAMSVSTGATLSFTQYYVEKLTKAKASADTELQAFLQDVASAISEQTLSNAQDSSVHVLNQLKTLAQHILLTDALDLAGDRYKLFAVELMKLKDAPETKLNLVSLKHLNKLLIIISGFSRLFCYLDIDGNEIDSFVTNVQPDLKKLQALGAPGGTPLASSAAVTASNVPTRVCRICEKKIKDFGNNIETHTQKCLSIQAIHDQCETINQEIIAAIKGAKQTAKQDVDSRRATRRMTMVSTLGDERIEEYTEKLNSLPRPVFVKYRQLMRDYNAMPQKLTIKELVAKIKELFNTDDTFYFLKGFVSLLPPNVQVAHCADLMERIWKSEDAELKSRHEIWNKMKQNLRNIIKLSPRNIDSFERCSKRLKQFQQMKSLYMTKACEGELRRSIRTIDQLITKKFGLIQEVFNMGVDSSIFDPLADLKNKGPNTNDEQDEGPQHKVSLRDFDILKPISRGSYGSVFLARKKTTGDVYAIKMLKKSEMQAKNEVEHVLNERNVLAMADNDFVVKMYYSFQTENNLYMVMEYLNGGDCFSLLRDLTCFNEDMARQYVAETVLALEYLHSKGIVHRDLKPDNMLISGKGHVKLTDFGLSQIGLLNRQEDRKDWQVNGVIEEEPQEEAETTRTVGTPDYIAPEVILGAGSGFEVDWWALGCIIYEFVIGITPFYGDTLEEIFENIVNRNIMWPEDNQAMSYEAMDLVDRLLAFEPSDRLGHKGAAEVKRHPWFKSIKWDTLMEQEAILVPKTKDIFDTSYFDARKELYEVEGDEIENDIAFSSSVKEVVFDDDDESPADPEEQRRRNEARNRLRGFSFINIPQLAAHNKHN